MRAVLIVYGLGVVCAALVGFLSPFPYLGFAPLAAGLVWAAYDLMEVEGDDAARSPGPQV